MAQIGQFFDATQYDIDQNSGLPKHPIGKFPANISGTDVKPTRENDGFFLEVEYTTAAGKIAQRFNLWNNSDQAVDIANKQLAALCYATGIYKLNMQNKGAELRGAALQIEVRVQPKNDKYNEVGKVFRADGNEPTKEAQQPAQSFQPQQTQQPAQPQQQAAFVPQVEQPKAAEWQPGGGATAPAKAPWA
jgi:hypothetical protein